jgi:hypothetical protein
MAIKKAMRFYPIAVVTIVYKKIRTHSEIALQDGICPDNPAFIQCKTSNESDETFPASANIPFQGFSWKLILLQAFTDEVRTSTFTLTL